MKTEQSAFDKNEKNELLSTAFDKISGQKTGLACRLKRQSGSERHKKGHPQNVARSAEDMIKSGNRQVKSR